MSQPQTALVRWERGDQVFTDGRYSRAHRWVFDGVEVAASSSPAVVRVPLSQADAVDPEEAVAAALSSCHMLFVLDFARKAGFRVDRYEDRVAAAMGKNERGKTLIASVTLNPAMVFSGETRPTQTDVEALHHKAHEECFVANSLRAEVIINPTFTTA
ncbi:OsmC family protein [Xanthobacter sp. KR7-225]|uniref:OsmC family protein n=1 Tax=Xanthobacter sp. KR7-225 TaxID=3156613 RepID=UPI0032B46A83